MPEEILKDATIFVNFNEKKAQNFFEFLGFERNRVHQLSKQWVHGIDVHCTVSKKGVNGMFRAWIELHNMIYDKYNLSRIKPEYYTAINKEKGNWGCIGNMDQLFERAKQLYPKYYWVQYHSDVFYNISFCCKILAASNLYISAAGSSCFNCLFMQNNTYVLFLTRYIPDTPAISCALELGIYLYGVNEPNLLAVTMEHFEEGLHEIMYVVENGKWKDGIEKRTNLPFNDGDFAPGLNLYKDSGKMNIFKQTKVRKEIPYVQIMCYEQSRR